MVLEGMYLLFSEGTVTKDKVSFFAVTGGSCHVSIAIFLNFWILYYQSQFNGFELIEMLSFTEA